MRRQERLAEKFRKQEAFTAGYSPLYAMLFGAMASWLSSPEHGDDPLVDWLVEMSNSLRSLDVTLLLAAGLHKSVLAGRTESAVLSQFYTSAGGRRRLERGSFDGALRNTIWNERKYLADFMLSQRVQTNETGRGLCWLLPLYYTGWPHIQLVDLVASAGLNLVAEQRAFRLIDVGERKTEIDIGLGDPVQFVVELQSSFTEGILERRALPNITGRTGCDLAPFEVRCEDDELTLMSYIWADQIDRLARLKEGIGAFKLIQDSKAPVNLFQADLPEQLPVFLHEQLPQRPSVPLVVYITYMSVYLADRGRSLGRHITKWAMETDHPVLWLQWEPVTERGLNEFMQPPDSSWCAWTGELWQNGQHHQWHFGWAHPHGKRIELLPGFEEWRRFWEG